MLKKIKIDGFKSIKSQTVDMEPINVLVGGNGGGKSNFVKSFEFLSKIVEKDLQDYVGMRGIDSILYFGRKNTSKINFELKFCNEANKDGNIYNISLTPTNDDRLIISKEYSEYKGAKISLADNNDKESKISKSDNKICKYTFKCLKGLKVYHFEDTTDKSPLKQSCNVNLNLSLESNGSNLPAILYRLKESEKNEYNFAYNKIIDTIQLVSPFFKDFILEPNESDIIRLRWKHSKTNNIFDVSAFSDGTLRFIALTTLLLLPLELIPNTIIIDEPELGLHPMAINVIAELIKSLWKQDRQIIVSSQSISFINNFEAKDLIVVDRINEESVFRRIKEDEVKNWLNDFSIGDIWDMNIIGGNPNDYE